MVDRQICMMVIFGGECGKMCAASNIQTYLHTHILESQKHPGRQVQTMHGQYLKEKGFYVQVCHLHESPELIKILMFII